MGRGARGRGVRGQRSEVRSQAILNFEFRNSNFEIWTLCAMLYTLYL